MISVQYSNGSAHRIKLPFKQQKQRLLTLAQNFVQYESSLPVEEQTPFTADLQANLTAALAAHEESVEQEISRKAASEALKRLDVSAKKTLNQIRSLLEGRLVDAPEQAQQWGFFVRQTGRGAGNILMPRGREEMIICLNQYIDTEEARSIDVQFTQPPLDDVITLRDALTQQLHQRDWSEQRRLSRNTGLEALCDQLSEQIRLALTYILLVRYQGKVNRDLAQWGFELVAKSPRRLPTEVAPPLPEEESIELPEPA